jgi:Leucine-rich repeat (LRR) protein
MQAFYCAGDATADSLLTSIDPAIGNCTALETLVLKDNQLTVLPDEITSLTGLKLLDVSGNQLCNVTDPVETWLDTYDPDWASSQTGCTTGIGDLPDQPVLIGLEKGILLDSRGRMVRYPRAASGMYFSYDKRNRQLRKVLIVK